MVVAPVAQEGRASPRDRQCSLLAKPMGSRSLNTAGILSNRLKNPEDTKMHMSGESLLVVLVVGLIAGWLAGQIVQGTGFGIVGDLLIGIAGAFIGSWLLPQLGLHRLGHCPGGHQRHHRRVVIAVGHQARSWRRPLA